MDREDYTPPWNCPACGQRVEALGPTSLALAIANHIHDRHERGRITPQTNEDPYPWRLTPPGGPVPLDDAFHDGARLTPFDRGFLRTLKVCWNPPKEHVDGR